MWMRQGGCATGWTRHETRSTMVPITIKMGAGKKMVSSLKKYSAAAR